MNALERLVGDRARFLSGVYRSKPEVTATGQDFSWLGSLDGFDHLINESVLPAAAFRVVRDGSPVPPVSYTRTFSGHGNDSIRVADPALVFDCFGDGSTIVLESLHRYSPSIRELCRDLELELRRGTQVNAYITPPNAQGFATHVDSHDVFVVQLHGAKHWLVFGESDTRGEDAPLIERDLRLGECLYIPKGFAHAATTSSEPSIHVTIGILDTTAEAIKKEILGLLDVDASMDVREEDPAALAVSLVSDLKKKLDSTDTDELARRLERLFFTSRHHTLRGRLGRMLEAEKVSDSDKLITRVEWVRYDDAEEIVVLLPDRELRFTKRLGPALDVVLRTEPFRVADLEAHLDLEDRRALVARLIREGLLELR